MGDEPIKEIGQRGAQYQTDFTQLFEDAPASNELMKEQGAAVADAFSEQFPELFEGVEFSGGPIKEWDRALLKLLDESTGEIDPAKGQNVVDLVRGRIVIDTADQVRAIREVLADPDTRAALGIEYVKDRFAEPSGSHYRDINIAIRLPDGHLAEIQINQRDMLAASEFTHDAYEDIDAIQTRAKLENRDFTAAEMDEIRRLENFAQDVHNYGAARFEGADELLNSKGRDKIETTFEARLRVDPDFVPGQTIQDGHKYDFVLRDGELPLEMSRDAHGGPGYKSMRNEVGVRPNSITAAADNIDISGIEIPPRVVADLADDAAGMGKVSIGAATGQFFGRHSMSVVGGGAAAFSMHQAFAESEQGEHTVALRGSAAALDVATVVDDALFKSAGTQRVVNAAGIKVGAAGASTIAGGVAIVATTSAEIAVAVSNKDGNAAGTAAVIGTASLTGMAVGAGVGSIVPVVGTTIGAGVGAVVGAGAGIVTTTYSAADEWAGRQFNSAIYHGSIFNDGIIATTTENLAKVQEFRTKLADGEQLTQEETREMQELMEEMRDDMMDLRQAEIGQAQAFATTGDERDGGYLSLNRELQTQIQETLAAVDQEFDQAQQSRLDQIMGGASSAAELMAHLDGNRDALALIEDAEHEIQWFTFSDHEDWQESVDDVAAAVTNPATGEVAFTHLTEDERLEQQRELHNVRENVEERINNLLVQARDNSMNEAEYQELVALKATLEQIDTLEAGFIAGSAPLGDQVFSANQQTLRGDARELVGSAGSASDLITIMAQDENFDVVRGNDSISQWSWFGNNHDGWKEDVEDIAEKDLSALDDDDLLSEYEELEDVAEEVNDRIYNLMQKARDGEISEREFTELQSNYELLDQIEAEKSRFNDEYVSRQEPEQPQVTAAYTAPEVLPESGVMANGFNECAFCPIEPILLTDLQMNGDVSAIGDNTLIEELVEMGIVSESLITTDRLADIRLNETHDVSVFQPT